MEDKVIEKAEKYIEEILKEDLNTNNLDNWYKLSKIKHMAKEDKEMNYGNYNGYGNYSGRGPGHGSYGNEYGNYGEGYGRNYGENYGRRGYDAKYRGHDYIDRMGNEYGRYMESRERYGSGEESDKAFHFMTKALGEYIEFLHEEAQTPQQKQMLNEIIQRSMR